MKKILLVLIFFLLSLVLSPAYAQETKKDPESVNSFELFWPLVAGKVKGDKFYSLKTFKENARGFLIFGKPQKADYSLFIATKRILEVEKLAKDNKKELSLQTLDVALNELVDVENNMEASGDSIKSTVDDLNLKFDNLEIFLPWLITQYKDNDLKDRTQKFMDKVVELHSKI